MDQESNIIVNSQNLSRFTKRLKKALDCQFGDTPLNIAELMFAKSMGLDTVHNLKQKLSGKTNLIREHKNVLENETSLSLDLYEHDDTISFKSILDKMSHEMLGKDFKSILWVNAVSLDTKNMNAEETLSYYFYVVDKWIHEYKITLEYNDFCGVYLQFDNETKIMLNSATQNCYAKNSQKFNIFQNIILEKIDTEFSFLQKQSFFKFMNEILKRKYDLTYKNFKKIKIEDMSVEYKTTASDVIRTSKGNTVIPDNIERRYISGDFVNVKYKNEIMFQILVGGEKSDEFIQVLDKENNQIYRVQTNQSRNFLPRFNDKNNCFIKELLFRKGIFVEI